MAVEGILYRYLVGCIHKRTRRWKRVLSSKVLTDMVWKKSLSLRWQSGMLEVALKPKNGKEAKMLKVFMDWKLKKSIII